MKFALQPNRTIVNLNKKNVYHVKYKKKFALVVNQDKYICKMCMYIPLTLA